MRASDADRERAADRLRNATAEGRLLADLRGVEAHGDHRVGAHQLGVLDHAVDGVAARVLEQLRVLRHLAAA